MVNALWLIPGLPLIGAGVLLVAGRRLRPWAGYIASLMLGGSFFVSLTAFSELIGRDENRRLLKVVYDWISIGDLYVPMGFKVDPLTAVMLLVVTGVGTLIHIYSIGYMADDDRRHTFFAYLNLFAASMLVLVLASNFLVLFLGWELVGLCSYLLISFWHRKPSAASAGKKAFIVNRVGDFGFLIAIFLIYATFGTLDMDTVFSLARVTPLGGVMEAIPLLLLLGCTGKSAQIPLYVWLPDAMEGPTPVSALIHAATMVTAGVYLVARAHVLFELAPIAGQAVVIIGIATAFFAATMAMAQDDIKRVLAYSTISQLGYMFVGVGVGALTGSPLGYVAAIFHLVTHAFFKALLFLGAGSVMHAVGDETDMKKMGGLFRAIPVTATTFILGWLAIAGIFPFSGFFSKEAILGTVYEAGLPAVWWAGVTVSMLTSFYMSRQVFLTFFGVSRLPDGTHPHESPPTMTIVLQALASLAVVGGLINLSMRTGKLVHFLAPVFGEIEHVEGATPLGLPEAVVGMLIVGLSLAVMWVASILYLGPKAEERRDRVKGSLGPLVGLVRNKYYLDEIYNGLFVWPGKVIAAFAAYVVDVRIIDGAVNGVGTVIANAAQDLRRLQTGSVRRYVMTMFSGAVLVVALVVWRLR